MKKLKFEEALAISQEINRTFEETMNIKESPLSPMKMRILLGFQFKYGKEVEVKKLKDDIYRKHENINRDKLDVKISKITKALIDIDALKKKKSPDDKRRIIIEITEKGEKILDDFNKTASKLWEEGKNV